MAQAFQSPTRRQRTQLRQNLVEHFDLEELRTLCSDLGVDYDGLRGEGKIAKARELVEYLGRTDRIPELVETCERLRPNVTWKATPGEPASVTARRSQARWLLSRRGVWLGLLVVLLAVGLVLGIWLPSRPPRIGLPGPLPSVCATSTPLYVGVARLRGCPDDFQRKLVGKWTGSEATAFPLDQVFETSDQARAQTGFNIVAWGACQGQATQLSFELLTTRKPDEVYEPGQLNFTGALTDSAQVGLALIGYEYGDYEGAINSLAQLTATQAMADYALVGANSKLFNGEYKGAVQAYERVVELRPDWGYAYNNLGVARLNWALSGQGGPQDLSDFGKAIARAGEDANLAVLAYYNQSDGLLWQGNNDKRAEAVCQQALDTKATSALPHVCFALYRFVHFTNAKAAIPYGDIETDLKQAQESSGDLPARFYCLRARWNWDRRQWQAARDDYWHCLSLMQHRACLPNDRQYVEKATDSLRQLSR